MKSVAAARDRSRGVSLELVELSKHFGELQAVDKLSLSIPSGEVFGFLGPNGAGKTTTISMICGLLTPNSGKILIDGQPVYSQSATRAEQRAAAGLRRLIGYCPQALVTWERLTCVEQLVFMARLYGLAAAEARRAALRLLEELGLSEKQDQQSRTLSGGMQRRLNIALALVHDPPIVVLDEPEAGLDPQSRALVRDYVRRLAGSRTVIVTTHNMDEAERMSDRIAVVDHGKLLVLDTPQALLAKHGADGRPAPDLEYVFLRLTGRRLRE